MSNPHYINEMFGKAVSIMGWAHAPYSEHIVGAVIRADDGEMFSGVNVENSSYGVTMCAERNALGTAVTAGPINFSDVLIVSSGEARAWPCGMCRQALAEFGDMRVWTGRNTDDLQWKMLHDLLPERFEL